MCGDASGSGDLCLWGPDVHGSWGPRVGDKGACFGPVGLHVAVDVFRVDGRVGLTSWVCGGEGRVCLQSLAVPIQCVSVFAMAALRVCVCTGMEGTGRASQYALCVYAP